MLTFVIYFTLQKSESTQKSQSTLSYPEKYSNQEGMGLSCILSHKDEINVVLKLDRLQYFGKPWDTDFPQ